MIVICTCLNVSWGNDPFCDSFTLSLVGGQRSAIKQRDNVTKRTRKTLLMPASDKPLPEGPHAAHNHNSADNTDTLVLWDGAGELFADHYVHVILKG